MMDFTMQGFVRKIAQECECKDLQKKQQNDSFSSCMLYNELCCVSAWLCWLDEEIDPFE